MSLINALRVSTLAVVVCSLLSFVQASVVSRVVPGHHEIL